MGWLKKTVKKLAKPAHKVLGTAFGSSNPTAKAIGGFLDPGGLAISNMHKGEKPRTIRNALDPGGYFAPGEQTPQTPYTPGQRKLSPAAQQMYDSMLARREQRASGQPAPVASPTAPVAPAPPPVAVPAQPVAAPAVRPAWATTPHVPMSQRKTASGGDPYIIGGGVPAPGGTGRAPYADGGRVCKSEHSKLTNKSIQLQRNGKPY
jgi:hypothetical protein